MTEQQFASLLTEIRRIVREEMTRLPDTDALMAALENCFGSARFTAGGADMAAEECADLFDALVDVGIDMSADVPARRVAIGKRFARMPGLVDCGTSRGARLFQVRG